MDFGYLFFKIEYICFLFFYYHIRWKWDYSQVKLLVPNRIQFSRHGPRSFLHFADLDRHVRIRCAALVFRDQSLGADHCESYAKSVIRRLSHTACLPRHVLQLFRLIDPQVFFFFTYLTEIFICSSLFLDNLFIFFYNECHLLLV